MIEKIKVGVFGAHRGITMINVLLNHPDAVLVSVCDKHEPSLQQVKKVAEEKGVSVTLMNNFDDFLRQDMDAVVLANYATEHATFAIRCLKAGKHVLSEVLPCETMAQAVELIEAVEQSGKVYAYAENYCYMRHAFEMWQRYEKGEIGEVMYAEGEYIHDCSSIWPRITYGERTHWRNLLHANYYCTHSLGPILTITGRRPVSVVGFETIPLDGMPKLGSYRGTGIELVTLDNGAVAKSIHGDLKREPGSINYEIYGQKGMMESGRLEGTKTLNVYREGESVCVGAWENYDPINEIAAEKAEIAQSHGGSDFYPTHFFIEKILGRPDGKWSIDVYTAIDMGICGILAYRSVLAGNVKVTVPNLRNIEERDAFRTDNACTNPDVAKEQLLPRSSFGEPVIPDEVYEAVRKKYLEMERSK
jgi:Predicted dehydrogenases and related proteins